MSEGTKVVVVAFLIGLYSFGVAFYGIGLYLAELHRLNGWSIGSISTAITAYYILSAVLTFFASYN